MREFVKSLRRLYIAKKITLKQISNLLIEGKITNTEYNQIVESEI